MSEKTNGNIIAIDGSFSLSEREEQTPDYAKLEIEGESIELSSFILSGESKDNRRVVLTWRSSPDELLVYLKTIELVVNKKIESIMELDG